MAEHTAESDAPRYHSRDCMDAYPGPCVCGVDRPQQTAKNDSPVARHEHNVSCAFGNPQCGLFMENAEPRTPWWRRLLTRVTPPAESAES